MNYVEKLEAWYQQERSAGRLQDIKFFPGLDPEGSVEKLARAVYETVTGQRTQKAVSFTDPFDVPIPVMVLAQPSTCWMAVIRRFAKST